MGGGRVEIKYRVQMVTLYTNTKLVVMPKPSAVSVNRNETSTVLDRLIPLGMRNVGQHL